MEKEKLIHLYFFLTLLIFLAFFLITSSSFSFSLSTSYTILNQSSPEEKDQLIPENEVINFLFLGIAGEGSRGSNLTDTILIISVNKTQKRINLISLPRDLLVKASPTHSPLKINALFELENAHKKSSQKKTFELIKKKVSQITGLEISEVIVLDLEAVKTIVDKLGGIDIYLEKDIYDPNLVNPKNPSQIFYLEAGWRHLDGDTFLKLIRTRYAPEGDFSRMKNQQLLLLALKNKISQLLESLSIISWIEIWQSISNHYWSTLSFSDLINLFISFKDLKEYTTKSIVVANSQEKKLLNSTFYPIPSGGLIYALIPRAGFENYNEIQDFIFNKIYENN
ncbi:MAG: LCP family protein [Candidatus Paceibacterota bacterium]